MDIYIRDPSYNLVGVLDTFESFIWTEKFRDIGDFELYATFSPYLLSLLKEDYYVSIPESDRTMIIDSVNIKTDVENGNKLVVKGVSLESILNRRIVLKQLQIDSTLQGGIQAILNSEIINAEYPERNFPNFIFSWNANATLATKSLKTQYYTDNVLDIIMYLCEQNDIGFSILLNSTNQYVFSLSVGTDRSYEQSVNPHVIFSPEFDNLLNSDFFKSNRFKKNYAFIAGEEGLTQWNQGYYGRWAQVWDETVGTGLSRKETFFNASYLLKFDSSETEISDADYSDQLAQRGREELTKYQEEIYFDAQIDLNNSYKYKQDFYLGDYVQMINEFGMSQKSQVVAMTFANSLSGTSMYPTLKNV